MAIKDFAPRPQGAEFDSFELQNWLDALGRRQNIDDQVELTTPATGDEVAIMDVSASAYRKITLANLLFATIAGYKVGTFTQDVSTASGAIAYTGVGFQPRACVFLSLIDTTSDFSIGFDDGSSPQDVYDYHAVGAGAYSRDTSSITVRPAVGDIYQGVVSAFGADGFTISWTKTGTPTGTLRVLYLALR